jgi:myo-inositol 2-dehydrogenase/D-chiro-inositol 1-dehydrogenase
MDKKLKFGVLGAGRIGKIHARNLASGIAGTEVVAVADESAEALSALSATMSTPRSLSDYRRVLEMPEVDAVAICTPTNTHYQMILDAAAAGKHIFCEKPIDLDIEKIRTIAAEVKKAGVRLMVGFNRRFDSNFRKVYDTVQAGKVGTPQILRITSRDPAPPPASYVRTSGGIFLDMTIHDFDMARFLLGDVTEVFAVANVQVDPMFREAGDWDTAVVTLTFASGALGTIDNSRKAVYGYDQRVEVFGSAGMVSIGNNFPDQHTLFDHTGGHSPLPLNFFMERYAESYRNEMAAFVETIRTGGPAPVDANDGLLAVVIGLAAAKSAREHRPVKLVEIQERSAGA